MLNLDFFSVGIAVAGNIILGFGVFFARRKSATSILFLLLTIALSLWSIVNYFSYKATDQNTALLLVRLVMFFAVPIGTLFFLFATTFPNDLMQIKKKNLLLLIGYACIVMFFTLTPWIFNKVSLQPGGAPSPTVEPGIILFIVVPVIAIFLGIFVLVRRTVKAKETEKKQFRYLSLGIALMFAMIIVLDFILPSFLKNTIFIPLSALFTLPFVFFSAYAIIKHHLLDVKIIATEVLVFILAVAMLLETILSGDLTTVVLRLSIFLLVLGVGLLLIRSVRREVEQREQLQILTKELEKANEQLKVLDQARAEFISIASHQLRTPPATIKWYLAALLGGDYGEMTQEVRDIIQKAEVTNNSLISLIDDMLNASRIERGTMEFLFEETDIEPLAQLTVDQLTPQSDIKKLKLVYHKPKAPLPHIMADKEKLRQVMNNFIDNAIKYTKEGTITVDLTQDGDVVKFQVSDTGKGIAPDAKGLIFEKYSRGKDSVSQAQGLGLGLYVAKIIIAQHKGKIWAESDGVNKGSQFIFTIPIHSGVKTTTLLDLAKGQ